MPKFSYDEFMDFLSDLKEYGDNKRVKLMYKYLSSENTLGWVFNPPKGVDVQSIMPKLYNRLCSKRAIKTMVSAIDEYGVDDFPRSSAVFLFSVVRFALDAIEDSSNKVDKELRDNKINRSVAREKRAEIDRYSTITAKLNNYLNKMVKREAKKLERETGLPREIASCILKSVPEKQYIDKYKISTYMNILLNELYSNANDYSSDIRDVEWRPFFRYMFGKEGELDAAIFILLEGVHRIKGMNGKCVHKIWDSLTAYALDALENADGSSRDHMLELYLKRLAKMIANGTAETRVDLMSLSEDAYPKLTKTVTAHIDKFKAVLKG